MDALVYDMNGPFPYVMACLVTLSKGLILTDFISLGSESSISTHLTFRAWI